MVEKKTAFEQAKQYYPRLWDKTRIVALYEAGILTEEEYKKIAEGEQNDTEQGN